MEKIPMEDEPFTGVENNNKRRESEEYNTRTKLLHIGGCSCKVCKILCCCLCLALIVTGLLIIGIVVFVNWETINSNPQQSCPDTCQLEGVNGAQAVLDQGKSILDAIFTEQDPDATRCCPDIGCFDKQYPFDVLPLPECVNVSQISFTLHTAHKSAVQIEYGYNVTDDFSSSSLVFIIHGYQSHGKKAWVEDLTRAVLSQHSTGVTVVVVDWSYYSARYFYGQSAANSRAVGSYTALMIQQMTAAAASYDDVWCIGHSLGAHACGYAGLKVFEFAGKKLGRITGLDPAGPCFECQPSVEVGLHQHCAQVVEVVHTDADGRVGQFGTKRPLGHIDFYPNGLGNQPGCTTRKKRRAVGVGPPCVGPACGSRDRARRSALYCSHARSRALYTEALQKPGACVAHQQCTDVDTMPASCSNCTQEEQCTAVMGFQIPDMYNTTTSNSSSISEFSISRYQDYYNLSNSSSDCSSNSSQDFTYKMFFIETGAGAPFCVL